MIRRDWFLPFGFHIIKRSATDHFGLMFWRHRRRVTCDLFLGSTVITVRRIDS